MKIALHGYGKMGKAVERIASERGHTIVSRFFRGSPPDAGALSGAGVIIDFSQADALGRIVDVACSARVNLVIGTTGWNDQLDAVRSQCAESGISVVKARIIGACRPSAPRPPRSGSSSRRPTTRYRPMRAASTRAACASSATAWASTA